MTPISQYYRDQFPIGIRGDKNNPNSVVYAIDEGRILGMQSILENIFAMGDQLQIKTATIALDDWETFLGIPIDTTLTYSERRARIIIKLSGQPSTIANIKAIAKEITGVDITIYEYGIPNGAYYDPENHPWKVKIIVDKNLPGAKSFNKPYFESIMKEIFPAHTEFEDDSFEYIAKASYLAPVTGDHTPLVLGQEFLQIS